MATDLRACGIACHRRLAAEGETMSTALSLDRRFERLEEKLSAARHIERISG